MMRILVLSIAALLILPYCNTRKKEEQLNRQQAELNQLEQKLLLRETTLRLKEEELLKREKKLDSATLADTNRVINPYLVGRWSVKMTCTQTTCAGSAVGDTKMEQWDLSYRSNHVIAKAMVNNKLVRVYSGLFLDNALELIEHKDTSLLYDTRMVVRLLLKDNKTMEGQREIIRENDCKIVYALRMDKQ